MVRVRTGNNCGIMSQEGGMQTVFIIILVLVFVKSVVIGSNFSFWKWAREGKAYWEKYSEWQNAQP